jgi:pre-rRNA-processing protein TSR1
MHAPVVSHSHRSTTKVTHKPFKARKATKGALKELSKGKLCSIYDLGTVLIPCRQDTRP